MNSIVKVIRGIKIGKRDEVRAGVSTLELLGDLVRWTSEDLEVTASASVEDVVLIPETTVRVPKSPRTRPPEELEQFTVHQWAVYLTYFRDAVMVRLDAVDDALALISKVEQLELMGTIKSFVELRRPPASYVHATPAVKREQFERALRIEKGRQFVEDPLKVTRTSGDYLPKLRDAVEIFALGNDEEAKARIKEAEDLEFQACEGDTTDSTRLCAILFRV